MYTKFGGYGSSGLGDYATFRFPSDFPFGPWTIVHGGRKIESAQKIHASRVCCEMHANQFWWLWPLLLQSFCYILYSQNYQVFLLEPGHDSFIIIKF